MQPRTTLRRRLDARAFYEDLARGDVDKGVLARAVFFFAVPGTTLLVLATALAEINHRPVALATAMAGYAIALVALVGFDRLPRWTFRMLAVGGTALIAGLTLIGGEELRLFALVNLWVALYAVYFLSVREAIAQLVVIAAAWAAVFFVVLDPRAAVASTVMMAATLGLSSTLVMLLRSRLRDLLAAEREQNQQLRELDRLKDSFVASVSHELRTPLTSIRGYLDLVLAGEAGHVNAEQRQFLSVVDRNADRLLRVVSDLLFVAHVDAAKLALELGDVDLADLAAETVEAARPLADANGVDLAGDFPRGVVLRGDASRLSQLLDNLVSNAVKFTPPGGRVRVGVSGVHGRAALEVSDTGIGISAEDQQRLFTRFFRTSEATERAIQGTGLGLSIAKAIVDAHGGAIGVESSPGAGTTFRVELPLAHDARRAA